MVSTKTYLENERCIRWALKRQLIPVFFLVLVFFPLNRQQSWPQARTHGPKNAACSESKHKKTQKKPIFIISLAKAFLLHNIATYSNLRPPCPQLYCPHHPGGLQMFRLNSRPLDNLIWKYFYSQCMWLQTRIKMGKKERRNTETNDVANQFSI